AQSRLSLLFNAFLKVPMQFMILLTGVLVFVFYHFHAPPLLWNPVALARLERQAPAEQVAVVRDRYERAHAARRGAALDFVRLRGSQSREEAAAAYLSANGELQAARGDATR